MMTKTSPMPRPLRLTAPLARKTAVATLETAGAIEAHVVTEEIAENVVTEDGVRRGPVQATLGSSLDSAESRAFAHKTSLAPLLVKPV